MNSSKMLQPTQPASNDTPPSTNAFFPHHVNPPSDFFQFESTNPPSPIDCCVPMISNPLYPLPSNPLPSNPTVDCCGVAPVPLPDSPDFKLPVNVCHEYIKRKVLQHGIGQELLTSKFYDCIEQLQRIHRNFDPIVCQHGLDSKTAYVFPCPNVQRDHDACQLVTIRLILKKKGNENDVYCQTCARMERKQLVDVDEK